MVPTIESLDKFYYSSKEVEKLDFITTTASFLVCTKNLPLQERMKERQIHMKKKKKIRFVLKMPQKIFPFSGKWIFLVHTLGVFRKKLLK